MHSSYNYSDFIDLVPRRVGAESGDKRAEADTLAADPEGATANAATLPPSISKGKLAKG